MRDVDAVLTQLPDPPDHVFVDVLDRDYWLARMQTIKLPAALEERLLEMLEHEDPVSHGRSVALKEEAQGRASAALAYWRASARRAPPGGAQEEAIAGTIRTVAFRGEQRDPAGVQDMLTQVYEAFDKDIQVDTLRALVFAGTVVPSYADVPELSRKAQKAFAAIVEEFAASLRPAIRNAKGTHEVLPALVGRYTTERNSLARACDSVVASRDISTIVRSRQGALKALASYEPFALAADRPSENALKRILGRPLSDYVRDADGDEDEASFSALVVAVGALYERCLDSAGEFEGCFALPVALTLGRAAAIHRAGRLAAFRADVRVSVTKPAAVAGGKWIVGVALENHGAGEAKECELVLQRSNEAEGFKTCHVSVLGPAGRHVHKLGVPGASTSSITVPYRLTYRDRAGSHEDSGRLRITRQREIDWAAYVDSPSPYSLLPITSADAGRLQGRDNLLSQLRRGVRDRSSFIITGQRRVGKTSLAQVFLSEFEGDDAVLSFMLPIGQSSLASGTQDLGRVGRDLADRIVEEYELKFGKGSPVPAPAVEELRLSPAAALGKFFRMFMRRTKLRLVIALDDFDYLPESLFRGSVGQEFFLALRALMFDGVVFLFVGSERLPAIMSEQAELLNVVQSLPVDYLERDALRSLVTTPAYHLLEFDDDALLSVERWSARNPYYATLLSISLWDRAIAARDYLIGGVEVDGAVDAHARTSNVQSYQHFWSDSGRLSDEERALARDKALDVLLAVGQAQSGRAFDFVGADALRSYAASLDDDELDAEVAELVARRVLEIHPEETSLLRIRVPMFSRWLNVRGTAELREGLVVARRRRAADDVIAPEEVLEAAGRLEYAGATITTDAVRAWLTQFGDVQRQRLMLPLIRYVNDRGLFTLDRFQRALASLDRMVRAQGGDEGVPIGLVDRPASRGGRVENWFAMHADAPGKSGAMVVRLYRAASRIYEDNAGSPEKVAVAIAASRFERVGLVCVDDFVGSGRTGVTGLTQTVFPTLDRLMPDWKERVAVFYVAVAGYEEGLARIEEHLGAGHVMCAHRFDNTDRAFDRESGVFATPDERLAARNVAEEVGAVLQKRFPLGYGDSQALVVFPAWVPNNTLPIFWKEGGTYRGRPWHPLFPRA